MFTHRLNSRDSLRQLRLDDAAELFAICDANRAYLRRWLPWLDRTNGVADTLKFLEGVQEQSVSNRSFQAAILVDGRIAGVVGYHHVDWQNRATSLGYWLAEAHQGRGLMTASCQVLIDHGFAALNLHRIAIACATGNDRSRAIPTRLGFQYEGRQRGCELLYGHFVDHEIYAQLQPEWQLHMIVRLAQRHAPGGDPSLPK